MVCQHHSQAPLVGEARYLWDRIPLNYNLRRFCPDLMARNDRFFTPQKTLRSIKRLQRQSPIEAKMGSCLADQKILSRICEDNILSNYHHRSYQHPWAPIKDAFCDSIAFRMKSNGFGAVIHTLCNIIKNRANDFWRCGADGDQPTKHSYTLSCILPLYSCFYWSFSL